MKPSTKLAMDTYFKDVADTVASGQQRAGQAYWNVAVEVFGHRITDLTASELDPYHDDTRIPQFLNIVVRLFQERDGVQS